MAGLTGATASALMNTINDSFVGNRYNEQPFVARTVKIRDGVFR